MNKRQLIAMLSAFRDEAEILVCVHRAPLEPIVRAMLDTPVSNDEGRPIVHVDINTERPRRLRAVGDAKPEPRGANVLIVDGVCWSSERNSSLELWLADRGRCDLVVEERAIGWRFCVSSRPKRELRVLGDTTEREHAMICARACADAFSDKEGRVG